MIKVIGSRNTSIYSCSSVFTFCSYICFPACAWGLVFLLLLQHSFFLFIIRFLVIIYCFRKVTSHPVFFSTAAIVDIFVENSEILHIEGFCKLLMWQIHMFANLSGPCLERSLWFHYHNGYDSCPVIFEGSPRCLIWISLWSYFSLFSFTSIWSYNEAYILNYHQLFCISTSISCHMQNDLSVWLMCFWICLPVHQSWQYISLFFFSGLFLFFSGEKKCADASECIST